MAIPFNLTTSALILVEVFMSACAAALCLLVLSDRLRSPMRWIEVFIVLAIVEVVSVAGITGVGPWVFQPLAVFTVLCALSVVADPRLRREREAEGHGGHAGGIVGSLLAISSSKEATLRLNFFRLFWVFFFWCFLGFVLEEIWWVVVVEPGTFQSRAGMLFGPFSPIYGLGATLLTVVLNRLARGSRHAIFLVSAACGCAFEVAVSFYMQSGYGATSWDYSDAMVFGLFPDPLSQLAGGRTSLLFACIWGSLGLLWIKALMPRLIGLVDRIPWKMRYLATGLCFILMMANGVMTLQALGYWQARLGGAEPTGTIERFYASQFNDEFMQRRFESMTITP